MTQFGISITFYIRHEGLVRIRQKKFQIFFSKNFEKKILRKSKLKYTIRLKIGRRFQITTFTSVKNMIVSEIIRNKILKLNFHKTVYSM